ncbi:ATP-dependent DNA helicase chl1 [Diatrype stigma]|uniref:ATP-dependent DNA helicase CHL1 n=1 Tax=Diatrype stigma TaxID=117547 RepID=A0AAN9UXR6_9PEZI
MDDLAEELEKIDFHHPFTPYNVQEQFMRAVYDVLERGDGQVGILESPTGTGKSLSLICAAVTWLRNHKKAGYETAVADAAKEFKDEPDWIVNQMLRRKRAELLKKWEEKEARLARIRAKEKMLEQRGAKRRRVDDGPQRNRTLGSGEDDDDEWLLADRDAADGATGDGSTPSYSKETRSLMEKLGMGSLQKQEEDENLDDNEIKIYYTSRTHSQLTQFISELRRPAFPPSIPDSLLDAKSNTTAEEIKHVPLSSRQRLCINPAVSRLGSLSAINDRCAELQQPKSAHRCQFVPNADNLAQTHEFRDNVLASVPDIEDLFELGKKLQVCPYYSSRTAIPGAEIITLPYPLLLQKTARDALGIKLEGNVVVIDEAHNIMDAVSNVYAAEISLSELKRARQMLGIYVKKFGKKLKGENRVMVAQVARVVDGLSEWLDGALKLKNDQGIVDPNVLLKTKGIDQINLYSLIQYIQASKLAYKIEGYVAHTESQQEQENGEGQRSSGSKPSQAAYSSTPVLHILLSFLVSLTNLSSEGRIFYEKVIPGRSKDQHQHQRQPADIKLSYLLLSPTHAFSSIATSARAVVLAGGTMSPFDDYTAHLFPSFPPEKITTLSCGHVIPPENLCVWTLASLKPKGGNNSSSGVGVGAGGVGGIDFEFSFQKRGDKAMIRELGIAILNICAAVPDGVVVFFPSYGYLDEVVGVWGGNANNSDGHAQSQSRSQSSLQGPTIWQKLQARKAVFRETKGGSSDEVLEQYSRAILGGGSPDDHATDAVGAGTRPAKTKTTTTTTTTNGALLLSVVGGKMSEGINFSDRLGRCVVIVGLPYPNINSADWKARIEYIESTMLKRLLEPAPPPPPSSPQTQDQRPQVTTPAEAQAQAKQASRAFYENACMRAVNQSIGRAVRHRGDYAAIVLLDRRFASDRVRGKLPGWIRAGLVPDSERGGLGQMMGRLSGFFRGKKDR